MASIIKVKNTFQFVLITIITIVIIAMFILAIRHISRFDTSTYSIDANYHTYNKELEYVTTTGKAKLKMQFDGDYKLIDYVDSLKTTNNLGKNAVLTNDSSSQINLYGIFYEVMEDGTVKKINKENKINKLNGSRFYKINDRKYLIIDKRITSSDGSISTKDYLIVELDKQGNSTLYNDYINLKEINPLILNTSSFDFDIANEMLYYNESTINLKKIVGSTNEYKVKESTMESTVSNSLDTETINSTTDYLISQNEALRKQVETQSDYYNSYFNTVKNTFNNLNSSLYNANQKNYENQVEIQKAKSNIKNYNLSRWISIGIVQPSVTNITVNYNIFDPNNEYKIVFLDIEGPGGKNRNVLNKEKSSVILRDLSPETTYKLTFGYTLASDDSNEIVEDIITTKTGSPKTTLNITKVTKKGIYFYVKVNGDYSIDSGTLNLYSDGNNLKSLSLDTSKAKDGYTGFIEASNLGYEVVLRLENTVVKGERINLNVYSKFVNADD